ncbi:uncharacterized protein (DUF58 family) [Methanomicrobium sp. W14]|uniref:DUF58 domain-containing protein n=1 Tax=Methanomicrobium sp. W14 TaxID=2817839 RepID=UPI001AE24F47|nr:DUF58 domain-containing protein [Methanomicrobium sp. W14]MBP2133124.1 uncharacterized protein (DUF58 family) [Methanomicrobium sp. W14]
MKKKRDFLVTVSVVFLAAGYLLRDKKIIFAGLSISAILFFDLFMLDNKLFKIKSTLFFSRGTHKKIITGGKPSKVKAECRINLPDYTAVEMEDLIPDGAFVTEGTNRSGLIKKSGSFLLNYEIICQSHGINRFKGIVITAFDTCFERKLKVNESFPEKSEIKVFPKPSFVSESSYLYSGKNTEKPGIIMGDDIKWLREYSFDDDLRNIDWKASAKHEKLYVRDRTSIKKDVQVIFIDLPDKDNNDSDRYAELLRSALSSLLVSMDKSMGIRIIEISGANVKKVRRSKNIQPELFDLLNEIKSAPREKYLYNYYPGKYERKTDEDSPFFDSVKTGMNGFYDAKTFHIFEKQVHNILMKENAGKDIFVIAVPKGDLSHLKLICGIARFGGLRSFCYLPNNETATDMLAGLNLCGFNEVKVI